MSKYNHQEIEAKWQRYWSDNKIYKVDEDYTKEKFYVLDMFPYPSGEGLHVGHPLGYIASDIYSRYKKHLGYNVLHPMGYDSFGLPAEQFAIQTGQHPAITTEKNIKRYREQLDKIGFSYDWDREVRTSDPEYYRWTQWIFKQLFNSWYNLKTAKAEEIDVLVSKFNLTGSDNIKAYCDKHKSFTAEEWKSWSDEKRSDILMHYRLTYLSDSWVNWCPELGTVLANDEIKDGVSERGGYSVEQRQMRQWSMRITAYADRLLDDLTKVDFSDSLKEQQRNWIGRSEGAIIRFKIEEIDKEIEIFTTRPDTVFGVSFMTLAPEHSLVNVIVKKEYRTKVEEYQKKTALKSERERQAGVSKISGQFTGAYALNPFTNQRIPIWIGDYIISSYGSGAVMAVPAGDQRDYDFAKHFDLPIPNIFKGVDLSNGPYVDKKGSYINSEFINGISIEEGIKKTICKIEEYSCGYAKTNYRLRNAIFSRQRYWGEPFPVYYKNNIPYLLEDNEFITLPEVDKYLPTAKGEPPLARANKEAWSLFKGDRMDYNTMPGWAGSAWYFLRYMDPKNKEEFVNKEKADYWNQVDLYIGGAEHAVGHLLYSRFWIKFLFDKGYISFYEPFKKLINQGMIGGAIEFMLLKKSKINNEHYFISKSLINDVDFDNYARIPVHINFIKEYGSQDSFLNSEGIDKFRSWRPEYKDAIFEFENGVYHKGVFRSKIKENTDLKFITKTENGKMSKRYFNTIDPIEICQQFGADTLRCYEMFLGPLEDHKPWSTQGISGVYNFLNKLWRLFHIKGEFNISNNSPSESALKTLHKTIKKVTLDLDRFSFNTVVSAYMIAINELTDQKCNNKEVLSQLLIIISPYAPHICEELWKKLENNTSISTAIWPNYNEEYLKESVFEYPITFNGKMRFKINLPLSLTKEEIEEQVMNHEKTLKYLEGNSPKKIIIVPKRIVNIVI